MWNLPRLHQGPLNGNSDAVSSVGELGHGFDNLISGLILDTHTMDHHGPRQIIAPISIFAHICSIYNIYIDIYIYRYMIYMYIYNTFHFMCRMRMKIPVLFPS